MHPTIACRDCRQGEALEVLHVLDVNIDLADAFVRCRTCDAHYLIELIDLKGSKSLYRVSLQDGGHVAATIRSLTRGSCDINRARNEVSAVASSGQDINALLIGDRGEFEGFVTSLESTPIPHTSWRSLPLDGSIIERFDPLHRDAHT